MYSGDNIQKRNKEHTKDIVVISVLAMLLAMCHVIAVLFGTGILVPTALGWKMCVQLCIILSIVTAFVPLWYNILYFWMVWRWFREAPHPYGWIAWVMLVLSVTAQLAGTANIWLSIIMKNIVQ